MNFGITADRYSALFHAFPAFGVLISLSGQESFGIKVYETFATSVLITNKYNIWSEINNTDAGLIGNNYIACIDSLLSCSMASLSKGKTKIKGRGKVCYDFKFSIKPSMCGA